ncbi:MAG: SBBP repeat-containing protein [Chitinophagales bacterium]
MKIARYLFFIVALCGQQATAQNPVYQVWGTYFGGSGDEVVTDIKFDKFNNVYVVGTTTSTSGVATGPHQTNYGGGTNDGFIVKFDKNGARLWSTYIGGSGQDDLFGCAVDTFGNVFVSGTTTSPNNIAFNGFKNTINSLSNPTYGSDAFLIKFDGNGMRQWGTYLGSIGQHFSLYHTYQEMDDYGYSCATDLAGNVFLAGKHQALYTTCYDSLGAVVPCTNTYVSTPGTVKQLPDYDYNANAFLVKFSSSGARVWGTYYGGVTEANAMISERSIAVICATDRNGNIYLGSSADSAYVSNLGLNGFLNTAPANTNAWLAKLNPQGTSVLWSTYYGGYNDDCLTGISVDSTGNVYFCGSTTTSNNGNVIATPGAFRTNLTSSGTETPYLVKMNSSGSRLWGTYIAGDNGQSWAGNCAVDNKGNVVTSILAQSPSGISYPGNTYCGTSWSNPGFSISRFSPNGQREWADIRKGDLGARDGGCVAISQQGKTILQAGHTDGFQATVPLNAFQNTISGGEDGFLVSYRDTAHVDTICGHVFSDLNANGVMDNGEPYLPNVSVWMPVHNQSANVYTDTNGYYSTVLPVWGWSGSCVHDLFATAPNSTIASIPASGSYPLSILGQHAGCIYNFGFAPAYAVSGTVYYDVNHNGVNNADPGIPAQSVSFNNNYQAFTDDNGNYSALLPLGSYTESFDRLDAYANCVSNPSSYFVSSFQPGSSICCKDFGAYFPSNAINSAVELWQWGIPPVPGQTCQFAVTVSNFGSVASADTVVFHYDPLLTYNGNISGAVVDMAQHTISFTTSTIVPARRTTYYATFSVASSAVPGSILHNWVAVNPTAQPDSDVTNNVAHDYETVLASFDPNNKISETNRDTPTLHTARLWSHGDDYIRYVINFQNTGTFNAYNIVVLDSLSPKLDLTSVRFISSSFPCTVNRVGNVLSFKFLNIQLPPSSVNDSLSHGYIVFKVKPNNYAVPGDSIENRAAIYFDYNTAVLTENNVVHLRGDSACRRMIEKHIYDNSMCQLVNYVFQGDTIRQFGIHNGDTLTSVTGCDSVTILHLTRNATINYTYLYDHNCRLQNYYFSGRKITAAGVYRSDTVPNRYGCDSVAILFLSTSTYSSNVYLNVCDSINIYDGDTLRGAGNFVKQYTARDGCDSFVTVHVNVGHNFRNGYVYISNCTPPFTYNGRTFYLFGTYYDTIPGTLPGQCDSLTTIHYYQQYYPSSGTLSDVICGGYYNYYGNVFHSPGAYYVTLYGMAQGGCDSAVYLYLTDGSSFNYGPVIYLCDPSYYHNGQYYHSGDYFQDTLLSSFGCDSVVITYVLQGTNFFFWHDTVASTCSLQPIFWHGRTRNVLDEVKKHLLVTGSTSFVLIYFSDLYTSLGGCDSFDVMQLWVNVPVTSHVGPSNGVDVCGHQGTSGQVHPPGITEQVFTTTPGCDSLHYENNWPSVTNEFYICPHDSVLINGHWRTISSDSYVDTFTASCGVDSIIYSRVMDATASHFYDTRDTFMCPGDTIWVAGVPYATPDFIVEYTTSGSNCKTIDHYLNINYYPGTTSDTFYTYSSMVNTVQGSFPVPVTLYDTFPPNACSSLPLIHSTTYINPPSLSLITDSSAPYDCHHAAMVRFKGTGGQPPYSYHWNTGDTVPALYNLSPGHYSITLTDQTGAHAYNSYYVDSLSYYNYLSFGSHCFNDTINTYISFYGRYAPARLYENGILVDSNNAQSHFRLANLRPGHHLFVASNNGCIDTVRAYIPGNAAYFETVGGGTCSGSSNALVLHYNSYELVSPSITVNIDHGAIVRTYHQVSGTDTFSGLTGGYHYYTATAPGCTYTDSFLIVSGNLQASLRDSLTIPGCSPQHLLYPTISAGQAPFHYVWSTGDTTSLITVTGPATIALSLTDNAGCNTHLNVTVAGGTGVFRDTVNASVCAGQSYSFGHHQYTSTGTYIDTFSAASGCDSIRTLVLSVGQFVTQNKMQTICYGDSFLWHGHYYNTIGIYRDTAHSSNTCDTIWQLQLSLRYGALYSTLVTICAGETFDFYGHPLSAPGIYRDTLKNTYGCDSILEVRVSVDTITPVVISKTGNILGTAQVYASYQWLRDGLPVIGANTSQYNVSAAGAYMLAVVDSKGCRDTSSAIQITGLNEAALAQIAVYPNPNDGHFTIENAMPAFDRWKMTDALGRTVATGNINNNKELLDVSPLANGAYFLHLENEKLHWKQTVVILR